MSLKDGRAVTLCSGAFVLCRPGGIYLTTQDPRDRISLFSIHFDLVCLKTRRCFSKEASFPFEFFYTGKMEFVDSVLNQIVETSQNPKALRDATNVAGSLMETLLSVVFYEYRFRSSVLHSGVTPHHEQIISKISTLIREDPGRAQSVKELSRIAGYSTDHFSRIFKKVLGVNPEEFIIASRMRRAQSLLTETDLTVAEVADALSFKDVFFFSKQFKQKIGMSPTAFRESC